VKTSATTEKSGSVLIIVLWISLGLVTLALYFANTMSLELRAADNRWAGAVADQAIEGGARYVKAVLTQFATNGVVPAGTLYQSEAVPVGEAHFWLIGRAVTQNVESDQVFFGLIDEGAKINVNYASAETLLLLTNMTEELAANVVDWRDTNGATSANGDGPTIYARLEPGYMCKTAPFETVDELKLVYPMDLGLLYGEDRNLNGALDPGEMDTNRNNVVDPGLLEYLTVYSKEPNTSTDGSQRVNVSSPSSSSSEITALLQTNLTSARLTEVLARLGISANQSSGGSSGNSGSGSSRGDSSSGGTTTGQGTSTNQTTTTTITSPLAFYQAGGFTLDEFAVIGPMITVTNGSYLYGRVNVNDAPAQVLACLPGLTMDLAQQLVNYRKQSPDTLTSVAWVAEALGQNNADALEKLAATDCITTQSYQFLADIAALGPHGRGYRRVRFVFDTSSGEPSVVYRQDLSHLGWALGPYVRQTWAQPAGTVRAGNVGRI
jgi:type II secretory pathway component PulK